MFPEIVAGGAELVGQVARSRELWTGIITAGASVAVAIFTYRTWRVYVQMTHVMEVAQRREWMPLIEVKEERVGSGGKTQWTTFKLRNVGRGHALKVSVSYGRGVGALRVLERADLAPGEELDVKVEHPGRASAFEGADGVVDVVFEDVFGAEFAVSRSESGLRYALS